MEDISENGIKEMLLFSNEGERAERNKKKKWEHFVEWQLFGRLGKTQCDCHFGVAGVAGVAGGGTLAFCWPSVCHKASVTLPSSTLPPFSTIQPV